MAFSFNEMSDAIKQLAPKKAIVLTSAVSAEWVQVPSVSNYAELTYVDSDASFVAYSCNDFSSTTTVTMTGKTVQVTDLMNETGLCKREVEKKWFGNNTNFLLGNGLDPYQSLVSEVITEPLTEAKNRDLFMGTNTTTSCNGLVAQLKADGDRVISTYNGTDGYTGFTYTNAITVVDEMIGLIPEKMAKNKNYKMYMSFAKFDLVIRKIRDAGGRYFAPEVTGEENNRFKYTFGRNQVEIVATHELYGTDYIILAATDRLFHIYRADQVISPMDVWYDINSKQIRYRAEAGFVPAFVSATEIVTNF